MKTKFTLLTLVLLFTATFNYAQTSAEIADIAVQGIARDNNNTAKINTNILLTFELYYLDANNFGNKEVIGDAETVSLATDAFGVFSHIISPIASYNAIFANQQVYLKISEGLEVISEEKLKHVPYAIAASNGVPTGSIMPFVGGTAPTGWVLCNGQSLTSIKGSGNLIALLGSNNAPNLQAMYLRGAGSQNIAYTKGGSLNYAGIDLKEKQTHTVQLHNHAAGTLGTSNTGAHQHNVPHSINDSNLGSVLRTAVNRSVAANGAFQSGMPTSSVGNHAHAITGSTANGGTAGETRPVSYGVNYIIKL